MNRRTENLLVILPIMKTIMIHINPRAILPTEVGTKQICTLMKHVPMCQLVAVFSDEKKQDV
jgi:hypothetical protein